LNQLVNVDPFSDASPAPADAGGEGSFQDPFAGAPAYVARTGSSSHNAGKSCIHSGCHGAGGSGGGAPSFFIGGTVYADYKGGTPVAGVEVRIVDAAGHSASTYSGPEGNFYISSSNANGVTFPAVVGARDGKTTRPMITMLAASMASCGQATCHVPGGGPMSNTGNYYPIHVP
jgi:hypothetical protein